MVTRSGKLQKTPSTSRGNSPSRVHNRSLRNSPQSSYNIGNGLSRSSPSNNGKKTPELLSKLSDSSFLRSRRSGSGTSREYLIKSSGSDTGSIELLDDDKNRIITSYTNQTEDNINVVVRVRPLSKKEMKEGDTSVIQFPGNGQILIDGIPRGPSGGQKPKLFSYNVVFEHAATQEDVLQYSGMKRLIEMALEGFRCTCFCYGQTGSGKTHTLTGPPGLFGIKSSSFTDKHGLIFRSFLYLFQMIQQRTDMHFILKASYLEIYNEKVIDLLNPGSARKPLAVRWSKKARGFFVENLFTVDCEELDDLIAVLEEGLRNRSVGRHNMNDFSSRSHTILTVYITSEQPAESGVFISRSGKINFVDLAGSEMTKKTQSEGKTLEEANNINKSLMVLGYCISSLSDSKRKNSHIPYRDSKLTKLLADSLAGNGVTLMIACISPAKSNISETINTLRYAARAKKIRTKPIVLMDPREALIISLKREVSVLQNENEHLRSVLKVYSGSTAEDLATDRIIQPDVDLNLTELEGPQLAELVRLYMQENETLRRECTELYTSRDILQRDHEMVCRENERLLKKLEEVNMSPLIPTRSAFSTEFLNIDSESDATTNIWTNPNNSAKSGSDTKVHQDNIPESIQKELDKRQLKSEVPVKVNRSDSKTARIKGFEYDPVPVKVSQQIKTEINHKSEQGRRFSMAVQGDKNRAKDVFGSVISLTDEEDAD